jgi:hypothetical protein
MIQLLLEQGLALFFIGYHLKRTQGKQIRTHLSMLFMEDITLSSGHDLIICFMAVNDMLSLRSKAKHELLVLAAY